MNYLGEIFVLALAITIVSAAYPQAYPQTYRYNLTLQTGNHSFVFKGLTKIRFSLNGYNYSYTNLTTYGAPNNYTKEIELSFSLANVRNVSVEWDYKWIDYPEFLIYRPKLVVKSFSIIPIYRYNHHNYRNAHYNQQPDIDLNLYDLNQYDSNQYELNQYGLNQYGLNQYSLDAVRYDLENQLYNSKNPSHRPGLNYRPNGHHKKNYANKYGLNHRYRERIHKFCPPVQNDGIEARNATVLVRCH